MSSRAFSQSAAPTPTVRVKLLKSYPHDAGAFTQGFELDPDNPNHYLESTGHYGRSTLRRVELNSGKILSSHRLSPRHFGEGLTRIQGHWVQLTWRAGEALRYDARTLAPVAPWSYNGEGWGLCFDGKSLWMSSGSAVLTERNPSDFSVIRAVTVRYNDQDLTQLNELECARGRVYANVWHQDWIAEIDPSSGTVTQRIDAASLRAQAGRHAGTLNGIAYRSKTDTFLLTGKNWSKIFEVDIARITAPKDVPGASDKKQRPQPSNNKGCGCAFFSRQGTNHLSLAACIGLIFGGVGIRGRRRSTAKCASAVHGKAHSMQRSQS